MPSASRLFALLYLFSLEKEEENGEKRKGKEAALAASPGARGLRRSEAGGEVRVAARSLLAFFFSFFFFFGKGGVSLCKPMTQPHMGRPRPLQRLLTTNRLSRGISGSAKVHIGAAGGRGGRALRALPGPAPPERPSRSAGGLGSRAGVLPLRPGLWPFLLRPFHVGPRAAGHVGGTRARAGLGAAPGSGPGPTGPPPGLRRRPTPFPAPRLQLPPGPPRGPLLPSQARGVRRGPAAGGTCSPQIRIRETVPAPGPRGGDGCGCAGRGPCVLELAAVVFRTRSKTFLHIGKKCSCCLDLARAIFKASSWWGAPSPAGQRRAAALGACTGLARRPLRCRELAPFGRPEVSVQTPNLRIRAEPRPHLA